MKIKQIISLTFILVGLLSGYSAPLPSVPGMVTSEQTARHSLVGLHTGMTLAETDKYLGHYGAVRIFTTAPQEHICSYYIFAPGTNGVSLVFNPGGRLAGWSYSRNGLDGVLTEQVSSILDECGKIKPGVSRAELLKVFRGEGGVSTARLRTYVHQRCPFIKVDVEFKLSQPEQGIIEERGTDIISKISKPYLEWSNLD